MKRFWKQLGKAICYFLLYFGVQNIIGAVYMMVYIVRAAAETAGKMAAATDLGLEAGAYVPEAEKML